MRTRNQLYATRVFEKMEQDVPVDQRKKYGSLALKLPVLIRTAGLAQALAFAEVRGEAAGKRLLDHIAAVVGVSGGRDRLLEQAREVELVGYMDLTRRILAALTWYGRFARAVWGIEPDADEEGVG